MNVSVNKRAAQDGNLTVATTTGSVAGFKNPQTGQYCYFGIPYAEPPVGALRFKPTVPKKPWAGTLNATHFGHAGPQIFDPTEGDYEEFTGRPDSEQKNPWVGSEDNLTLNIWTPAPDEKRRPVMVWIHGGANWLESSRLATYHGDSFVERGDVVFVSLNYRLGVFGFLDVSVLGGNEYKSSHSNGLRDQLTALRWVTENIEAFGGDPENITVMGESAGSINLSWLLSNDHLNGIAKRVVLMSGIAGVAGISGGFASGFTEAHGQQRAKDILSRMQIGSMDELLDLSTDQIMKRLTTVKESVDTLFYMDSLFYPRVDPVFNPADPFHAAHRNGSHGIDVMIGYTGYEMGLWLTWDETLDRHPCEWFAGHLECMTPATKESAVTLYNDCFAHEEPGVRGMHMLGDSIFVMPSVWFADELLRNNEKVWMYQYDWESDSRRRALHAGDQTYFFNKHDTAAGHHLLGEAKDAADRAQRKNLTAAMQDSVLAFIRSGDPNAHKNRNLPAWPRYSNDKREVMSFNASCKIVNDPPRTRRIWWEENIYKPVMNTSK